MNDIKDIFALNINKLRTSAHLTQAELAAKLNYSDKAISKWERGESLPDILVFKQLAELFEVSVDYLITEHSDEEIKPRKKKRIFDLNNHKIITLLSMICVWFLATVFFISLGWANDSFQKLYMVYVIAVPVSTIVLLVLNSLWGNRRSNLYVISVLMWSALLTVFLLLMNADLWPLFLLGIPGQIAIILSFKIELNKKK